MLTILLKTFKTLFSRYQDDLETRTEENESAFDSVHLMYYLLI